MTVQETLEADITATRSALAEKEAALEKLKAEAGDLLTREFAVVKGWFEALKAHL